jgi:hypothetical protein
MPVQPPPDDHGFWSVVQGLLGNGFGETVFGWPDADEDLLRELAAAWRDLAALVRGVGATATGIADAVHAAWPDFAGSVFAYRLREFATGQTGLGQLALVADSLAQQIEDYAISVEFTKRQIVWEILINLPIWAATFAAGPAGWALGALSRAPSSRRCG